MKRAAIGLIAGVALLIAGRTLLWALGYGRPTDGIVAPEFVRVPADGVVTHVDPDRGDPNRARQAQTQELPTEPTPLELDRWADAAARVVRLSPDSFPEVPADVRRKILADGCTVPQRWTPRDERLERAFGRVRGYEPPVTPTNLVSGEFAAAGQRDWAVLCSINGRSAIRVYWGGPAQCQSPFESIDDVRLLQDYAFDYAIERATIPMMRSIAWNVEQRDANLNLPSLTHDGIHFYADKASRLYYCRRGTWLEFNGLTNLP